MDKSKAIELLKQALTEIAHLRELRYDNQEFILWRDRVQNILKVALDNDDLKRFSSYRSIPMKGLHPDSVYQKHYLDKLIDYETALKSVIQKYESLGIEAEPTPVGEPPKTTEEKPPGKELKLTLQGTPDMVIECMRSAVEKLNSQGYTYSFRRTSGAPDYARWDKTYFASCAISQGDEGDIGTVKLELIPNERIILKTSRPDEWNSSYSTFLNSLFTEFKRLGYLKEEKPTAMAKRQKDTAEVPSYLFNKMQFHPKVTEASKSLFETKHYAEAIFEAFKAVENSVREKSGLSSYGKHLMAQAFNEDNPLIQVTEAGRVDKDVQEGFKFLFMGATLGIRNPKAHHRITQRDPFITLEYLGFASFLLKRIERWQVNERKQE